jgi:hypothetical protein
MVLTISKYAVGLFSIRQDVEAALSKLKDAGFSLDKVSLFTNAWIKIARGEEDCINSALLKRGIPEDRARFYKSRLLQGNYLLMLENPEDEIDDAQAILKRMGIQEWDVYDIQNIIDEC